MPKLPFMQFYPHDWLYDTRILTDQEKGVLIDLLCFMWNGERRGILIGHPQDLARIVGKEWGEFSILLNSMKRKNILTVTERDGEVTLMSRRMVRDEKERESHNLRQNAYREKLKNSHRDAKVTRRSHTSEVRSHIKDSLSELPKEAVGLAELLKTWMLKNNPNARIPTNLERWALEADRILRIDKRPHFEAVALLEWCQGDPFWKSNILSMEKFRMQYDQLKLKRESGRGPIAPIVPDDDPRWEKKEAEFERIRARERERIEKARLAVKV